jgi:acyl carrier protein
MARNPSTTEQKVRSLLAEIAAQEAFLTSPADQDLEELGLDSVGMIDLMYRLEDEFKVVIEDGEVVPENFRSIQSLCRLLEEKCSSTR